jgi:hypothetical protein
VPTVVAWRLQSHPCCNSGPACKNSSAPSFRRPETAHDARAALLARLESLPAAATMPLVYGRLVPLHRVLAAALESSPAGDAPVAASQLDTLPLSSANVEPEGVYLLENSAEAWLYFGSGAPPALVADLLGEFPELSLQAESAGTVGGSRRAPDAACKLVHPEAWCLACTAWPVTPAHVSLCC